MLLACSIRYVQFFFNLSLLLVFLYCLVLVIHTIRRDVDEKIAEYSSSESYLQSPSTLPNTHIPSAALREIAQCSTTYVANRCSPETRIPLMEATCRQLEDCMNQDPSAVGRARVAAETFAQVANSFVEEISWKTLVNMRRTGKRLHNVLSDSLLSVGLYPNFPGVFHRFHQHAALSVPVKACALDRGGPSGPAPITAPQFIAPHVTWGAQNWQPAGNVLAIPETPRRRKNIPQS